MRKILLIGITLISLLSCTEKTEIYEISGRVTDLQGNPLDSVTLKLLNKNFDTEYETLTNKDGNYSMKVKKGNYNCLYAIRTPDYRVSRLEYWTWNVPVTGNLTINPQYDRMEIYGINVFEPQVRPYETYMIYFRPMSLTKFLALASAQNINKEQLREIDRTEKLLDKSEKMVDIAPSELTPEELKIEINGIRAEVLGINKVTEYGRGIYMYGYCVQVLKPEMNDSTSREYDFISITINSEETGESGRSDAFVKR